MKLAGTFATETELVGATAGRKKLVGLVATTTTLYASDQTSKKILKVDTTSGAVSDLATVTTADLLPTLPNTGFETVRGMAYDNVHHRLFIIDHSATVGTPDKLHIQPFTP